VNCRGYEDLVIVASIAVLIGLTLLMWSANRFIDGAASTAHHLRMPSLLIGMVIVGFGTSAPEMAVSAIAAAQTNAGIALGNAYGSNIINIALILGVTAVLRPITVRSTVLRKELPILIGVTVLAGIQLLDGVISRLDAAMLLAVFALFFGWTIWQGFRQRDDALGREMDQQVAPHTMSLRRSIAWTALGLVLLVASSRLLVWGAVVIARSLALSDLVIGLTIVAIGTSLPELAASIVAAKKGQHEIALGNILGSNLYNTLAVVGLAGVILPLHPEPSVLRRDVLVMAALTTAVFAFGFGFRTEGRISRLEGCLFVLSYFVYTLFLII
jgi:cation:H+ antiporter